MSARRLVAAAGAAVFALLLTASPAVPATASTEKPKVEWTRPTPNGTLEAAVPITGKVSTRPEDKQVIKRITFELVQKLDNAEDPCFVELEEKHRVQEFNDSSVNFELPIRFPCNRAYELLATVAYEDPLVGGVSLGEQNTSATPLKFKVAIPPAQITGLKATYEPATKQVGLTWEPNTERDLRGYRIERNPPGPAGFETLASVGKGEAGFTDNGIEAEHHYRVVAVREGPDGKAIEGRFSTPVSAGPKPPQPTLPKVTSSTPAPGSTPRATGAPGGGNRPTVRKRTATTVDTGFSQDLPFDPSQTTTTVAPTTSTEPEGQASVLAEFDDEDDADDQRATLVPIAGGLALMMSALHVRLLSKRVGEDDIPILPGS